MSVIYFELIVTYGTKKKVRVAVPLFFPVFMLFPSSYSIHVPLLDGESQ